MHVLLAGAGIGGLTAALALGDARVTLVERAARLEAAGAGIQLSPNATRVLIALGLGQALAAVGFEPEAAEVREAATGRLLLRQPLGRFARERWGAPYLHIHRADLQVLLLRAVEATGATLRLGERLAGVEQADEAVTARLESGERIEADALIGCDGLRSRVREVLWSGARPRFTGNVAWRGTVEAARLPAGLIAPNASVWTGPGRHFVHYFVRGGAAVNFVGVVESRDADEESWTRAGDPRELARAFAGWPEPVEAIVGAVEETWRWPLYDRPPLPAWSKGRASLLGDAAHPMLPFLAQGAAMAIEDAAALAQALEAGSGVRDPLAAYEAVRRPRTERVQAMSRRNARLFHLPGPVARAAFGAATALDRLDPSNGARRFDWLYGAA